jgi:predicted Zn-dependent protease
MGRWLISIASAWIIITFGLSSPRAHDPAVRIGFGCTVQSVHVTGSATSADIGAAAAQALPLLETGEIVFRVEALANRIKGLGEHAANYTIRVVDTSIPDACAFPGGYIFVTRGLIEQGLTDDELAFVIAHEVSHIDRNDTVSSDDEHVASQKQEVGATGHGFKAEVLAGLCASESQEVAALNKTRRQQEIEADRRAILILAATGYDVRAAISALKKVADTNGSACYLPASERQRRVEERLHQTFDRIELFDTAIRFLLIGDYRSAIDGLKAYRDHYFGREVYYNLAVAMHRAAEALMPRETLAKGLCSLSVQSSTLVHRWRERFPEVRSGNSYLNDAAIKTLLVEALLQYDEALRRGPDDQSAVSPLLGRGCLNLRLGKIAYAAADIEEAARRQPDNPLARNDLSILRIFQGNIPQAAIEMQRALELDPDSSVIRANAVILAKLTGDEDIARKVFAAMAATSNTDANPAPLLKAHGSCGGSALARQELIQLMTALHTPDRLTHLFSLTSRVGKELEPQIWSHVFASSGATVIVKRATSQDKPVELIRQIVMSPGSALKTRDGLGNGDSEARIVNAYGLPDHTEVEMKRHYLVYCERGLVFTTNSGAVVSWFVFQ